MIAIVQLLLKYALFEPFIETSGVRITLNWFGFALLILATLCIAAAGNIINDIYDVQTDLINKPHKVFIDTFITKKNAFLLYFLFTFVGIGLGSYVGFTINRWWISLIFIAIAFSLYLYSSHLKGIPIFGNIIISILVASSLLILIAFDKAHTVRGKHINLFKTVSLIAINIYAIFAFLINLMRELIKDNQDVNGDYNANMKTLSIVLGRNRVNKIVAVLAGLTIVFILYVISEYLQGKTVTTIYALLTLLLPLLYFIVKIWQADTKHEYRMLSFLLKLIMLFGILSTVVFYYFDPINKFPIILP